MVQFLLELQLESYKKWKRLRVLVSQLIPSQSVLHVATIYFCHYYKLESCVFAFGKSTIANMWLKYSCHIPTQHTPHVPMHGFIIKSHGNSSTSHFSFTFTFSLHYISSMYVSFFFSNTLDPFIHPTSLSL